MSKPIRQYFQNERPEMAQLLPTCFSVTLEIGCGAGNFTQKYLQTATEKWGIEPDADAALIAKSKMDKIFVDIYDKVDDLIPNEYFDLVICNDVIERMNDHDAFFESIKKKLKPSGFILGSVPNIRHFTALVKILLLKDFPYTDDGILDRTHKRFFRIKSLKRTLGSRLTTNS